MPPPNGPLQDFFSQYNFTRYTYDPHRPALEEFERLCEARQWGPSKIRKHNTLFLLAAEREQDLRGSLAGPNVIKFFREYEYQRFTYDFDAPIRSEFQRLVKLRGWGEANISKVTIQFNKAVELDAREQSVYDADPGIQEVDLLADWLRGQECRGYRYRGGRAELEFKKLVDVKRREWLRIYEHLVHRPSWKHSSEFESLRAEFYGVVEKVFNLLLDKFCQITGFTRWQVLVGLYGEGEENVERNAAKKVRSTKDLVTRWQDPLTLIISDSSKDIHQYIRLSRHLPRDSQKPTHNRPPGALTPT